MAMTPQARDNFETLRLIAEHLAEGDLQALLALGLEPEDIRAMEQMTLADLRVMSGFSGSYLRRAADVQMFRRARSRMQDERAAALLRDRLIAEDAPYALVQALFGTSGAEYAARRRLLGVVEGIGRPAQCDEAAEARVWDALRGQRNEPGSTFSPEEWIELQARTGESLRTLWILAQRFAAEEADSPEGGRACGTARRA